MDHSDLDTKVLTLPWNLADGGGAVGGQVLHLRQVRLLLLFKSTTTVLSANFTSPGSSAAGDVGRCFLLSPPEVILSASL